jgi:protein dispatched 1
MLPSNVLAYIQIGIFLVVVMTVSWVYATFFLMSLLSLIGPEFGFGQFQYPTFGNKRENSANKTVLQDNRSNHQSIGSEKLLSAASSAAGDLIGGSETHELDSLTSNSIMKSLSLENSQPINFDRVVKKKYPYPREKSPSTVSAITMIIPDDVDVKN